MWADRLRAEDPVAGWKKILRARDSLHSPGDGKRAATPEIEGDDPLGLPRES